MNILILEDEVPAARRIQKLVQELRPNSSLQGPFDSVASTVNYLRENTPPDLIIADIQLADGLSFDLFQQLQLNCPVIFTTAFDEYAIRAFRVNSIDYLLKPIDRQALGDALTKHHQLFLNGTSQQPTHFLQQLMHELSIGKKTYKSRFLVSKGIRQIPISCSDIAFFYTQEKIVFIQTYTNEQYIFESNLDELEELLDPAEFFRANRQFIVSIKSVQAVENGFNGKLHLQVSPKIQQQIIVSREKSSSFRDWLGKP
jgi:two-component system LytT family response regulator